MKLIQHWINGKPYDGISERTGPVFDPASGLQQAEVAFASVEDVDTAVAAAREAFGTWKNSPVTLRSNIFFKFRDLVDQNKDDIAKILVSEHGKTFNDALGEVRCGVGGERATDRVDGRALPGHGDVTGSTHRLRPGGCHRRGGVRERSHGA